MNTVSSAVDFFMNLLIFFRSDSIHGIFYKKKIEQFGVVLVFFFKNEVDDAAKKIKLYLEAILLQNH